MWNRWALRSFLNLLVSIVSLMLAGIKSSRQLDSMTEATFTKLRTSAAFDVVGSVGGPQTGSTAGFSDWLHRVNQVLWCTSSFQFRWCDRLSCVPVSFGAQCYHYHACLANWWCAWFVLWTDGHCAIISKLQIQTWSPSLLHVSSAVTNAMYCCHHAHKVQTAEAT